MLDVKLGVHNATADQYRKLYEAGFPETTSGSAWTTWIDVEIGNMEITVFMPEELREERRNAS